MIAAIIQARLGSTRFPRKIFAELAGYPLIHHVVERVTASKRVDQIVLATTVNPLDNDLAEWARSNGVTTFRGSEADVLNRFAGAALEVGADIVVRVTADDPFKDPTIIDDAIDLLVREGLAFAYNNSPPSYPEGLDTEVFTSTALQKAEAESRDPFEREHVTQYFYRHPEIFPQANLRFAEDLSYLRWTIDTPADYEMAKTVYSALYRRERVFLFRDVLGLLREKPEIELMNSQVPRSTMYTQTTKKA